MAEFLNTVTSALESLGGGSIPILIAVAAACIAFALFGYRIFKILLGVTGAFLGVWGGIFICNVLEVQSLVAKIIVCAVLAIVVALIMFGIYKLALFLSGMAAGAMLGSLINGWVVAAGHEMFAEMPMNLIIPIVLGIIIGILHVVLFRILFIIETSIGGMVAGMYIIIVMICGVENLLIPAIIGLVLGIGACVLQFAVTGKEKP